MQTAPTVEYQNERALRRPDTRDGKPHLAPRSAEGPWGVDRCGCDRDRPASAPRQRGDLSTRRLDLWEWMLRQGPVVFRPRHCVLLPRRDYAMRNGLLQLGRRLHRPPQLHLRVPQGDDAVRVRFEP